MRTATIAALAALALALPAQTTWAGTAPDGGAVVAQRDASVSLDEAARRIAQRTGGRVLAADTVRGPGGRPVHEIRVLVKKGRVRVFRVDAATGEIR